MYIIHILKSIVCTESGVHSLRLVNRNTQKKRGTLPIEDISKHFLTSLSFIKFNAVHMHYSDTQKHGLYGPVPCLQGTQKIVQ